MTKKRMLVTGGAGFIGSHLAEHYLEQGHHVKVLDDFSTGSANNIRTLFNYKSFKLIKGDVRNKELVRRATMDTDVIFHLAAQINVDKSIVDSETTCEVNVNGTLNILEAGLENDVELVVYASSSEVYGSALYVPMDEKHELNPASPYAASKVAADRLCFAYSNTYKLPVVIVRCFNTYGPRQADLGYSAAIPKFITRALENTPPIIYGDGAQTRDYMYVKDAIRAYDSVVDSHEKLIGRAVNFGTGKEISIVELANLIIRLAGREGKLKPIHAPARPGEVKRLCAGIDFATKELDFHPQYDPERGLREVIRWYAEGRLDEWRAYTRDWSRSV
jgi:UDP-glucose 4-epimerase